MICDAKAFLRMRRSRGDAFIQTGSASTTLPLSRRGECFKNRVGGMKTGLNEAESPLSRMYFPFCAHEVQRKRSQSRLFKHSPGTGEGRSPPRPLLMPASSLPQRSRRLVLLRRVGYWTLPSPYSLEFGLFSQSYIGWVAEGIAFCHPRGQTPERRCGGYPHRIQLTAASCLKGVV